MEYISEELVKQAYIKLKSYVYHDNTDLYLRRQLVEFETGITKKGSLFQFITHSEYRDVVKRKVTLKDKLAQITEAINEYNEDSFFFDELINKISINYYPKKLNLDSEEDEKNFITNKESKYNYHVEKVTSFINAPIELHIIGVLWIMVHGVHLDAQLGDECLGNRLILSKERDHLVQGSGLFKPYFTQYKNWRDQALSHAKQVLSVNRDVAFVNLDIKEYFNSIEFPEDELYRLGEEDDGYPLDNYYNLKRIFVNIHSKYTDILFRKHRRERRDGHVSLPIGFVSSYVLANYYLKKFDDNVKRHIKPIYYGRYVDDLLFVIADPVHPDDIESDDFSSSVISEDYTRLEKFVIENFHPILKIEGNDAEGRKIRFGGQQYDSLYCQSSKSLVYLFDAQESQLVIDKLKEELQERTSEFRDFPDEDLNNGTFTEAAYHLQYEDSKDKVRTLKDYKEDRFGLTLFLSNKIFSSLRQEEQLTDEICDEIIKFFRYKTAVEFYRLWERIFTLFLVNNKAKYYVIFYLQCIEEIRDLRPKRGLGMYKRDLINSLAEYLDVANEITFSLNLAFYDEAFEAAREFEFKTEKWQADIFFSINDYQPTKANAYWQKRFRRANMIRHHYIIHPLLNYTEASKKASIKNLVAPHIDFKKFKLDEELILNSPRRIKFWECNMALIFSQLERETFLVKNEFNTEIFTLHSEKKKKLEEPFQSVELWDCMLDEAYDLFQKANRITHIPDYEWLPGGAVSKGEIFTIDAITKSNSPEVRLNEIRVKDDEKRNEFKVAFVNTKVIEGNILSSIRGKANMGKERMKSLGEIIKSARKENADILLFPEFFIPLDLLSSIVDYARKNEKMVTTGLEHVRIAEYAYNFIVTVLPVTIGGVKDSVIIPRLKNHYAHLEQHVIEGNHAKVPKPSIYRYDLFVWKNIYFSTYYCFELANIHHRGLWKNKTDLMVGIEWNKDTPYYSNIVEATSRDLHCFFAQVNTSQYGDSRFTKPMETALKDLLRLKGGENDAVLVVSFEIKSLREFQRQTYSITHSKGEFKPLPPDFNVELVIKRIRGESVLRG